jgi:hypothetical protein
VELTIHGTFPPIFFPQRSLIQSSPLLSRASSIQIHHNGDLTFVACSRTTPSRLSACVRILVRMCPQVSACVRKKWADVRPSCPHFVRSLSATLLGTSTQDICIDNSTVVSSSGTTAAAAVAGCSVSSAAIEKLRLSS